MRALSIEEGNTVRLFLASETKKFAMYYMRAHVSKECLDVAMDHQTCIACIEAGEWLRLRTVLHSNWGRSYTCAYITILNTEERHNNHTGCH